MSGSLVLVPSLGGSFTFLLACLLQLWYVGFCFYLIMFYFVKKDLEFSNRDKYIFLIVILHYCLYNMLCVLEVSLNMHIWIIVSTIFWVGLWSQMINDFGILFRFLGSVKTQYRKIPCNSSRNKFHGNRPGWKINGQNKATVDPRMMSGL